MNRTGSDKTEMIAIYESTLNGFKTTGNKLFDYDTKTELKNILKHSSNYKKIKN